MRSTGRSGLQALPAAHAYDLTDRLSVSWAAVSGQDVDHEWGGAVPFQPEIYDRLADSDDLVAKFGFA